MSKRKFSDLNDIIDTAYVVADYSDSNRCYDNTTERDVIRRDVQSQEPYRVGFSSGNSFRGDRGDRGDTGNTGNIFLKNSQSGFQSGFQSANKTNNEKQEKSEVNKIVLNDDNFPSLGSKPVQSVKNNNSNTVEHKLDFKKIVEKKPEVVNKPDYKVSSTQYKKFSYNQYSLYQEVKEKSEKIAHMKMVDDISSDDNVDHDDNYY